MRRAHPAVRRSRGRGLAKFLVAVVATFPIWPLLLLTSPIPWTTRLAGGTLWALCFYPSWTYFKQPPERRAPVPFVAIVGLLYALYYARPLIFGQYNQHWRIRLDPTTDYNFPAVLALEGWAALLLGFGIAHGFMQRTITVVTTPYDARKLANVGLLLITLGALSAIAQEFTTVPLLIAGLSRFITAIGLFGTGLLTMLFARGQLPPLKKFAFLSVGFVPLLLQLVSGFISGVLIVAAVIFLSVWVARQRLSFRFLLAVVAVLFSALLLKSVVDDYRKIAWIKGKDMSVADRVSLVITMTNMRVDRDGLLPTLAAGSFSTTKRSANMDLLSDIVRRTPYPIPYWRGGSYVSLIGLAIPRFLWPDKPTKELGQRFGHRYSILDSTDDRTSFNFPFLVEFYANFGELGIVVGMFIVGIIYRIVQNIANRPDHDVVTAIAGIVLVLPLLNIESDFSLTFGGLLMDGVALFFVVRQIRKRVLVKTPAGRSAPVSGARVTAVASAMSNTGFPRQQGLIGPAASGNVATD
jgi:hypothetical protein